MTAVFDLLYNKYLETLEILFNHITKLKFTKDNVIITIRTNKIKIDPEKEIRKLNRLFFKNGCSGRGSEHLNLKK